MFGFLYGIFALFGFASEGINNRAYERKSKEDAILRYYQGKNDCRIYRNAKGQEIDFATGKPIYRTEEDGHIIVKTSVYGEVLRDVTQEKIDEQFERERVTSEKKAMIYADNKRIVSLWGAKHLGSVGPRADTGWRSRIIYKHFKTGRLCYNDFIRDSKVKEYFMNKYGWVSVFLPSFWYIDIFTGEVLDASDIFEGNFTYSDGKQKKIDNEYIEEAIEVYNRMLKSNEINWKSLGWEELFV